MIRSLSVAAGTLALLTLAGSAGTAFAQRNRYTGEEARELGYFILNGLGGTDITGEPIGRPYYNDVRGGRYYPPAPRNVPRASDFID